MAVFTPLSTHDVRTLLTQFELGELVSLQGIAAGIENTNYFLTTTGGEYILTVFEVLSSAQLPFYLEFMHSLAQQGLPVPQPQTRRNGERLAQIHNKPCTIVTRLPGQYEHLPSTKHCSLTGQMLARLHTTARNFSLYQPNLRGLAWWRQVTPQLYVYLDQEQTQLLTHTLDEQIQLQATPAWQALPTGPSHCDLFRDNVLFTKTAEKLCLGGFIDFYFAGHDSWLFDVAISVNDWCIAQPTGEFMPELAHAWLLGYAQERPFTDEERTLWPAILRAAALRFWISRLYDFYFPRPAQTLKPHDPKHFERVLQARCHQPCPPLP
jgi:homoserine kinase type II